MAIKQFAYYLKGNKLGLSQVDDVDNSSNEYGQYKSPTSDSASGLELQYSYSPIYNMYASPAVDVNKFYVNGWTVINGYLAFLRARRSTISNWSSSPESAVTSRLRS